MIKRAFRISTDRRWDLKVKKSAENCVDIIEDHRNKYQAQDVFRNYIVIPQESIDDIIKALKELKKHLEPDSPIRVVFTTLAQDEEELISIYEDFLEQGYEGAMARNLNYNYESKRSKHLQKMKIFQDAEFKIIGVCNIYIKHLFSEEELSVLFSQE